MVRIKVCGITNLEDALAAVEYGADALGFIFAPSPRRVDPAVVKEIASHIPPFVTKVGVFVDSEREMVEKTLARCNLDLVQLHGRESPEYCAALFPRAIKSFTIKTLPPFSELARYRSVGYLLDRDKGVPERGDAERLWDLAREVGKHGPVVLGGGLTPDNVARAIEVARPYAVDVASGVESGPGKKDHTKLRAFVEAARSAGQMVGI